MDIDAIKQCWRQDAQSLPPALEEETVMRMLADRTTDLRRQVRRRLRREGGYYLPLMAVMAASLAGGFTLNRVLAVCTVVFMIGGVMVTLRWAERRLEDAPLDRSLRDALTDIGSKLDAACRAYVAAYVVFFVVSSLILLGVIWWRNGVGSLFAGSLVIAALAVVWAYRSGRGYVERMFRRYRVDLSECLRQLDEQT
jgi:uncharacterized protein YneF (UPF0154 family)